MKTVIIHLRITQADGKSFLTQTRETGQTTDECLSKAVRGWYANDTVAITGHFEVPSWTTP